MTALATLKWWLFGVVALVLLGHDGRIFEKSWRHSPWSALHWLSWVIVGRSHLVMHSRFLLLEELIIHKAWHWWYPRSRRVRLGLRRFIEEELKVVGLRCTARLRWWSIGLLLDHIQEYLAASIKRACSILLLSSYQVLDVYGFGGVGAPGSWLS